MGWTGRETSLGVLRHHRLFLQQPLPLPHSTQTCSGVWGQWEVAGGTGLREGWLRSGPRTRARLCLGGVTVDSETRQGV